MVYMLRSSPPPIEYETAYFFDFYKSQYGKTYLEDFPRLIHAGKERLRRIEALLDPGNGPGRRQPGRRRPQERRPGEGQPEERRLLDIGCAYGPFLVAAREGGFLPLGIDPAPDAVRYVGETLGIPAIRGFFPPSREDLSPRAEGAELFGDRSFTVVSLWYVIEHFERLAPALEEIFRLLKPGGVLAFSTPSFSGVSGRSSRRAFLEKSPPDHWTIWTPRRCSKLLAGYGFRLKKIVVTGHHPERFPLAGRLLEKKKGPVYRFFYILSRIFRLGDTFEAYAVKASGAEASGKSKDGSGY
jgi:SAM-dependent methyltransferase